LPAIILQHTQRRQTAQKERHLRAPVVLNKADFPRPPSFIRFPAGFHQCPHSRRTSQYRTFPLLTGAFLSGPRFPLHQPPPVKWGPGYHFMDGGAKRQFRLPPPRKAIFISLSKEMQKRGRKDPIRFRRLEQPDEKKVHFFYFISITNNPNFIRDERKLVFQSMGAPSARWSASSTAAFQENASKRSRQNSPASGYSADTLGGGFPRRLYINSVWITGSCCRI